MKFVNLTSLDISDTTQSTVESSAIDLSQIYRLSAQIIVGAGTSMTGSVQLQVSNDEITNFYLGQNSPVNWSNLGNPTALSADSTNYLIASQDVCYRSLRVVFTGDAGNDAPVVIKLMALCV